MKVCLFFLRDGGTNLSHMKSIYINLVGNILAWLKLWQGSWTEMNIMLNFYIFKSDFCYQICII